MRIELQYFLYFFYFLIAVALAFGVLYVLLKIILRCTFKQYRILEDDTSKVLTPVQTLRVFHLNVFWRPWLLHLGKIEHVSERSLTLSKSLDEYDVVCLNESFHFGSSIATKFVQVMQTRGFKYVVTSDTVPIFSRFIIDSGLMILSKYPIISANSTTYTRGCSFDGFAAKGAIYAEIQTGPDSHVHLFTTHLQASYDIVSEVDFGVRNSQQKELASFIQRNATDGNPIIVTGDFNIDANHETYVNASEEFENLLFNLDFRDYERFDTVCENGLHPITSTEFIKEPDTISSDTKCLDYIFIFVPRGTMIDYKSKVNQMFVPNKAYAQISDHYALQCDVFFK